MITKGCDNCKHRYGYASACPCNTCIDTGHGQPTGWEAGTNYIPMTNADCIRAMSDEELAKLLCTADWCEICEYMTEDGFCSAMGKDDPLAKYCEATGLRWLRQPAEENRPG